MPITALPVKKNPTMPGRAWTSSVRKRLRWRLQRTGDTRQKCDKQERRRR
jgi:hypothetical protein